MAGERIKHRKQMEIKKEEVICKNTHTHFTAAINPCVPWQVEVYIAQEHLESHRPSMTWVTYSRVWGFPN